MLIKRFPMLLIKIEFKDKKFIKIPIAIPVYTLQELLDSIHELLTVTCLVVPKESNTEEWKKENADIIASKISSQVTIRSVREMVRIVIKLLDSLAGHETYDFVDVTTDEVKVLIKVM